MNIFWFIPRIVRDKIVFRKPPNMKRRLYVAVAVCISCS